MAKRMGAGEQLGKGRRPVDVVGASGGRDGVRCARAELAGVGAGAEVDAGSGARAAGAAGQRLAVMVSRGIAAPTRGAVRWPSRRARARARAGAQGSGEGLRNLAAHAEPAALLPS